jgi:hypothetical protein
MRTDHPIFKGPLDPKLELGETAVPKGYRGYPEGKDLPEKLTTWKVQTGKFPEEIDVGLVSGPWGFEDSPDAERISGGINSKGPDSVAIGRHGNFLLWGFAGDPVEMTESGRRVFINAVCYMKRFDGRTPLAPRTAKSRDILPLYFAYGDKVAGQDWFKKMFSEDVRTATGLERAKLESWYRENLEWIRADNGVFGTDADMKSLGVSNRKPEFFDAVLARLAKDDKDELAWRVVRRYVPGIESDSAAAVRRWVEENRARLFFTDVGGYRWFLNRE